MSQLPSDLSKRSEPAKSTKCKAPVNSSTVKRHGLGELVGGTGGLDETAGNQCSKWIGRWWIFWGLELNLRVVTKNILIHQPPPSFFNVCVALLEFYSWTSNLLPCSLNLDTLPILPKPDFFRAFWRDFLTKPPPSQATNRPVGGYNLPRINTFDSTFVFFQQWSLYYQPKQRTIHGKSRKKISYLCIVWCPPK